MIWMVKKDDRMQYLKLNSLKESNYMQAGFYVSLRFISLST